MSITIWGIIAFCVIMVSSRKFDLIDTFAFLLPFKTIHFELGLMAYAYYFPLILALLLELFFNKSRKLKFDKPFLIYILYVFFSTVIISNLIIDNWEKNVNGGFFREEGRYISTLIRIIFFQAGICFIVFSLVTTKEKIIQLLKSYLFGINTLVIIGALQFGFHFIFDIDLYPYGIEEDGTPKSVIVNYISDNFDLVRVSALGGEPKGLAASIVVGLSILILSRKFKFDFFPNSGNWIIFYLFILVLTLSTGGYGLLAIFSLVVPIVDIFRLDLKFKPQPKHAIIFVALISVIASFWNTIQTIIDTRIIQRSERLLTEDVDQAIQDFMVSNPKWCIFGSGSGNIHNLAYSYIDDSYLLWLMEGEIFVSRYGLIRILSENGLVGFLLFSFFIGFLLIRLSKRTMLKKGESRFWTYIVITATAYYFARSGYVEAELFFICGLALSFLKRKNHTYI